MTNLILTILILYLLYKLVFDFIVPVSKTTSQFKQQVDDMKKMQEEQLRARKQQNAPRKKTTAKSPGTTTTTDGEYIDYEEVK